MKTDAELVARAQRDPAEFGVLFERYYLRVFRFCLRRLDQHQDAEDVAQTVFIKAFLALASYEDRGLPVSAWLYRIAANTATQFGRRRAREVSRAEVSLPGSEPDPVGIVLRRETSRELLEALQRVTGPQRAALILCYAHGCRGWEAAERLGTTEGSVKQILRNGRLTMREALM